MDRTFTASGLTPHTNYTFRVAAVNSIGTGPFSAIATVLTSEDSTLSTLIFAIIIMLKNGSVPGPVSNLMSARSFTFILLSWSAPQEPNGVIISYEVTYRVNGTLVISNTTDLIFVISSLSSVTDISVSAYTSVGRGDPAQIDQVTTLSASGTYVHGRI